MSADVHELRATAEDVARRAGVILREKFHQPRTIEFKGGIDLVTDADKASEREILSVLRAKYPDHGVLAEESGARASTTGYRWLIDPLDGTTNYSHQVPHFCVSVAVENEQGLLAGVIYDPLRDELFSAALGQGARRNGAPMKVSGCERLDRALLCTGFPYDVREHPEAPLGLFSRFIRKAQGVRRMGSAALDLAYVADGRYDGFFEFGLKAWDVAAGALLIREAGGVATGIRGQPLGLEEGNILGCNALLETQLREECRKFLDEMGWSLSR